jgi:hypothetical protein
MPFRRLVVTAAVPAAIATVALATSVGPAAALAAPAARTVPGAQMEPQTGILPPHHPSRSLAPHPNFLAVHACSTAKNGAYCNRQVLRATGRARRLLEHMRGMSFSLTAYRKLSHIKQLFVTVNLERVARGLAPAAMLTKSLDAIAQTGARNDDDPPLNQLPRRLPGGGRWIAAGGNWAGGWRNPLGSNYAWMYDDGPGWGHRDNILGRWASRAKCGGSAPHLAMGAGYIGSGKRYGDSETELLLGVCGHAPTDVIFRWATAKRLLHVKF